MDETNQRKSKGHPSTPYSSYFIGISDVIILLAGDIPSVDLSLDPVKSDENTVAG